MEVIPVALTNSMDLKVSDQNLKILVISDYGQGKSVFASTFPTPGLVFDFDHGGITYKGKDFTLATYDMSMKGWIEFEKEFPILMKECKEGKYKTVVVDSTTIMSELAMERALSLDPKRSTTGGPLWNVHYGMVKNLVEGKLRQIIDLPCNVVVLAHMQVVKDEETGAVMGVQPLLPGALKDSLPGKFDEVYFAFAKKKGDKVNYVLQTESRGMYKARSRISGVEHILPAEVNNNYHDLVAAIQKKEPQE